MYVRFIHFSPATCITVFQENTYFHHCISLQLLVYSVDLHIFATLGGGVADEFFGEYGVGVSLISQVFDFDCHNPCLNFDFVLVLITFSVDGC